MLTGKRAPPLDVRHVLLVRRLRESVERVRRVRFDDCPLWWDEHDRIQ